MMHNISSCSVTDIVVTHFSASRVAHLSQLASE